MTLRGTVINGVIIPDPGQSLPEGTRVSIDRLAPAKRSCSTRNRAPKKRPSSTKPPSKVERLKAFAALSGIWSNRPEWEGMSSAQIAAELRRRSLERRRG